MRPTLQHQLFFFPIAIPIAIGMTISLLTFSCCKKDTPCNDETNVECPNYDPCWDALPPVSAAFRVKPNVFFSFPGEDETVVVYVEDEGLLGDNRYIFVAQDATATSYSWKVGSDITAYTGKELSLFYPCDQVLNQPIEVQLITERLIDTTCLDEGLLIDTFTRILNFVPAGSSKILGTFRGQDNIQPGIEYDVTIAKDCPTPEACRCGSNSPNPYYTVTNFINTNCTVNIEGGIAFTRERFFAEHLIPPFYNWEGCETPNGTFGLSILYPHFKISPDEDSLTVDFVYYFDEDVLTRHIGSFKGVRQ